MNKRTHLKKFSKWFFIGLISFAAFFFMSRTLRIRAYDRWVQHVEKDSCDIRAGMSRTEAKALLDECGNSVPKVWSTKEFYLYFSIYPRFPDLAWFYVDPFERGRSFRIDFDDYGKVQYVHGSCPMCGKTLM